MIIQVTDWRQPIRVSLRLESRGMLWQPRRIERWSASINDSKLSIKILHTLIRESRVNGNFSSNLVSGVKGSGRTFQCQWQVPYVPYFANCLKSWGHGFDHALCYFWRPAVMVWCSCVDMWQFNLQGLTEMKACVNHYSTQKTIGWTFYISDKLC